MDYFSINFYSEEEDDDNSLPFNVEKDDDSNDEGYKSSFLNPPSKPYFSQNSLPLSCNSYLNNTEQMKGFSEITISSNPKEMNIIVDEATNFSSIDCFSKNGINHAMNQALGQGTNNPSLKSSTLQVRNGEVQNLSQHIPQYDTSVVKNLNANSSPNQNNMNNPLYSCSNPLENKLTAQTPDSSPPHTQYDYTVAQNFSDDNLSPTPQEKSRHALIYKNGDEVKKLRKYAHYNQPYKNCQFYKKIEIKIKDNQFKEKVKEIGEKYNNDFKLLIESKRLPIFGRAFKRNLGLSVWFFESLMPICSSWIDEKINEIVDK